MVKPIYIYEFTIITDFLAALVIIFTIRIIIVTVTRSNGYADFSFQETDDHTAINVA